MVKIVDVEKGSPAAKRGIRAGDVLVSINNNGIRDVLDYRFYLTECLVELLLLRGEREIKVKIKKNVQLYHFAF